MRYKWIFILVFCYTTGKCQDSKWLNLRNEDLRATESNEVYQQFKEELTIPELEYYLHHDPLPHMRAYAFLALLSKRVDNLEELLNQYLDDTAVVSISQEQSPIPAYRMIDLMLYSMDTANYPVVQHTYEEYAKQVLPYQIDIQVDIDIDSSDLQEEW